MASDEFRRRIAAVHGAALVDYEDVARLRREVLAPMAASLLEEASSRRDELCAFAGQHPELLAYARFRADLDARAGPAPAEARTSDVGYHLYAQWAAAQQLAHAASLTPLYADLPVGVHPEGFDPVWAPRCLRGRGARRVTAGSLLRRWAGLVVPAAPSRAHA